MQGLNNIDHVSNNNSNRKSVTLSQQQADQFKSKAKQFQAQFEKQKAQFMRQEVFEQKQQENNSSQNKSQPMIYYIVSSLFLTQWRDFTMQHTLQRLLPEQMNINIFDEDYKLKLDLKQGQDFQFISSLLYQKYFKQFSPTNPSMTLKRRQIFIGKQKRIPLYLKSYKYLPLTHINLRQIDHSSLRAQQTKLQHLSTSQFTTVTKFLQQIKQYHRYSTSKQLRLWKMKKNLTVAELFQEIREITKKIYSNQFKVKLSGKKIDGDLQLCDLEYEKGEYFVVEVKDSMKRWHFYQENEEKCTVCVEYAKLKYQCVCKQIAYCSEECKVKDSQFHSRRCTGSKGNINSYANGNSSNNNSKRQQYETRTNSNYYGQKSSTAMTLTQYSSRGKVGLSNLGNTCFMNSCLQCLSNTIPLTQYFISGYYQNQINQSNPIGTHGKLARSYARFIKSMWCDSNTYFSPSDIKMKVASINPMFSGYAQHDSQEFFSFIVDGLHEDLNRVQKKPYVTTIDSQGRKDQIVALESWISYLKRNQSIIVDLMTGQYRSQVTCPDCKVKSVTFDPFITVTLPIPQKSLDHISFYLIYHNFQKQTQLCYLSYNKLDASEWMNSASKATGINKNNFSLYVMSANQSISKIGHLPMAQIIQKIQSQKKTVFMKQNSQEQINYKQPLQIVIKLVKVKNDFETHLWFKFPFLFQKAEKFTGVVIYTKILEFLYRKAYLGVISSSQSSNTKSSVNSQEDKLSKQEYLVKMLEDKPFQLYLKTDKREQILYRRIQYVFGKQILIQYNTDILQLIEEQTQNGYYQIHAKFTSQSLNQFKMDSLKNYDEKMSRPVKQLSQKFQVQLSQCFQHLSESQKLLKGNEWYCSKCKSHKLATKQMSIYKSPKILIIHLKRFKQKANRKQKNQALVLFPMQLNMKPYLIDPKPMSSYLEEVRKADVYIEPNVEKQIKVSEEPVYQLYAVSNHYGGMGGGHYTAFAKNRNKWYDFNDSSVRQISEMDVCKRSAYMLFYKRKD